MTVRYSHVMGKRTAVVWLMVGSACISASPTTATEVDATYVAAAEVLCPIMWDWQKDVGAAMNTMSAASRRESDGLQRRQLYMTAFSRVREINAQLEATIQSLGSSPPMDRLLPDVRSGLEDAEQILVRSETTVDTRYKGEDNPTYNEIVPVIFLDLEKVIDVAKPELASYDDQDLIEAFITVPQCQHGVKDANDGIPRYVP